MRHANEIVESSKVAIATGAPVLSFCGYPVEQWGYVLSGIVALFIIIEKFPVFLTRMRQLKRWIQSIGSK